MRTCPKCLKEKSEENFYSAACHEKRCKDCINPVRRNKHGIRYGTRGICHTCGKSEPEVSFHRGYATRCKECHRKYLLDWRQRNKKRAAEMAARAYQKVRVKRLAKEKLEREASSWRSIVEPIVDKTCRVCKAVKPLKDFPRNKQGAGGRDTTCLICARARVRAWIEGNPVRAKAGHRNRVGRRRARLKNAPVNDFTHEQWLAVMDLQDYCCLYCKRRFDPKDLTQDHMTPIQRGGSHSMANIAAACGPCNQRKGARTAEEFQSALSA